MNSRKQLLFRQWESFVSEVFRGVFFSFLGGGGGGFLSLTLTRKTYNKCKINHSLREIQYAVFFPLLLIGNGAEKHF